ncbi:putative signal transduction histidine kinase [Bradyrhizobium sp. ORS 285]|uniref:sensor histidine kinase n=1 Tax=Bradyrhizobium sp. ORS 285 TaxID=115808 RepID=UPI000240AB81|nr:HWE histidine kinase domain-containing protein [Bradyrhizobium sp. ORS 285]CCD85901.1 putative signal transduction histidine kinase [Bradyrhizobium sp. ORS 285]SMX59169.1 putative signal transduction histidine kinase [Bradyrhizobium sp. ORS 285]
MNLEDLYRLLRSSHVQAQGIVDTIDEPLLVLDERGVVLEANRAFFATFLVERDDTIGTPLSNLGNGQWNIPELKRLMADIVPKSAAVIDYEVTHEFPVIGRRTFLLTARRLIKPDNNSTHLLLVFSDVTASKAKERENSLLFSELRHRLINLLGVVQAIANQTETKGVTAEDYKSAFLARFQALAKAQALMAGGSGSIDLATLLSHILSSWKAGQLMLSGGPAVTVPDKQVVPLAMIVSELATNALKYGALGQDGGTVELSWQITSAAPEQRSLHLVWQEACTTPVSPPDRAGTGTLIIEEITKFSLQGKVELNFDNGALRADLVFPLTESR